MSAVSARSLGPMSSTKSSKSTCPPTVGQTARGQIKWGSNSGNASENRHANIDLLTVHVDLLAQFYQLHLCGHVSHSSHAVPQVFTANETIFVFVELLKCLTQLWRWRISKDHVNVGNPFSKKVWAFSTCKKFFDLKFILNCCKILLGTMSFSDIQLTIHFFWPQLSILSRTKERGQHPNTADVLLL